MDLSLHWNDGCPPAEMRLFGDVRDVLNSRAPLSSVSIPHTRLGLGLLGPIGGFQAGEGIIVRSHVARTPPTEEAGIQVLWQETTEGIAASFFVGIDGAAAAVGHFSEPCRIRDLYERSFGLLSARRGLQDVALTFLQIVAAVNVEDLRDRAIKKRTDAGELCITGEGVRDDYFKFRIIRDDLKRKGRNISLMPILVFGAGFDLGSDSPEAQSLKERIFYRPPGSSDEPEVDQPRKVVSHNHAVAWRSDLLGRCTRRPKGDIPEELLELLDRKPAYLVHLDESTRIEFGWLELYYSRVPQAIE